MVKYSEEACSVWSKCCSVEKAGVKLIISVIGEIETLLKLMWVISMHEAHPELDTFILISYQSVLGIHGLLGPQPICLNSLLNFLNHSLSRHLKEACH